MALDDIHMGTLAPYISERRGKVKTATVNRTLAVVRRILNLSARLWRDESGKTWLSESPLLQLLPKTDARKPRPITWSEQHALFSELPPHLARMALDWEHIPATLPAPPRLAHPTYHDLQL